MMKDLVSIVINFYNEKEYLAQAIDSMMAQTYDNCEILLIDDCSTDGSRSIAEYYSEKYDNVRYYRNNTNKGLAYGRNIGIINSKGEYIAFMDGDDFSDYDRIRIQVEYLNSNRNVVAVSGLKRNFDNNRFYRDEQFSENSFELKNLMLFMNPFVHPAAMIRKSLYTKHGLLMNEKYRCSQDYDFWLRCFKYGELHIIPQVLINYRIHDSSANSFAKEHMDIYDEWMSEIILNGWNRRGIYIDKNDVHYIYKELTSGRYIWKLNSISSFFRLKREIASSGLPSQDKEEILDIHRIFFLRYSLYHTPIRVINRIARKVMGDE